MTKPYHIEMMSGPDTLPALENWFRDAADREGLSEPVRSQIELILEELVTNVVNHASRLAGKSIPIQIEMNVLETRVELKIADGGAPFDPDEIGEPDLEAPLEERRVGGLGLFLVQQISDSLQYEYRDGWNVIYIHKNLGQEARS